MISVTSSFDFARSTLVVEGWIMYGELCYPSLTLVTLRWFTSEGVSRFVRRVSDFLLVLCGGAPRTFLELWLYCFNFWVWSSFNFPVSCYLGFKCGFDITKLPGWAHRSNSSSYHSSLNCRLSKGEIFGELVVLWIVDAGAPWSSLPLLPS